MNIIKRLLSLLLFLTVTCGIISSQTVTGIVVNETEEPLVGVTVVVEGKQTGTVTSIDGSYIIKVDDLNKDVLIFSLIGMKQERVPLEGKSRINVSMQNNYILMDEQVVIGYGTVNRRDLTGSVSSVNSEVLERIPTTTISEALTGRLAGVQVISTDGAPDSETRIVVRGGTSITQSNDPLYIVDGFPVSSISDLAPSTIASVDVLKDASSTAIYGSRASNGVVIITTKQPEKGRFTLKVNSYVGPKTMVNAPDVLDPYEYALWQYEHAVYKGSVGSTYERYLGSFKDIGLYKDVKGNNWKNIVLGRTGEVFNYTMALSGRNDNLSYSANYTRQVDKGIMEGSDYIRNNLLLKLNHILNKKFTTDLMVRYFDIKITEPA